MYHIVGGLLSLGWGKMKDEEKKTEGWEGMRHFFLLQSSLFLLKVTSSSFLHPSSFCKFDTILHSAFDTALRHSGEPSGVLQVRVEGPLSCR